jgi:hypothetical protein
MSKARLQLAAQTVFWRVFGLAFALVQLLIAAELLHRRRPQRMRMRFFLGLIPTSIVLSILIATVVTFVAAILVRLIVRPLVERWHKPPADVDMGQFHLSANERVVGSSPARRSIGRRWPPGTLIRTNLRLWFVPQAHDGEVWSCPLDRLGRVDIEPAPPVVLGFIRDWPPRISVHAEAGAETGRFAVPDPEAVLSWFRSSSADATYRPTRS